MLQTPALATYAHALPKAELHLHIEGTLEPEMIFALAKRNRVALRYSSIEALRAAYAFTDLSSFLALYYEAMRVLLTAADFQEMAEAYLQRAHAQNVRHVEIFFDPQAHVNRGVAFDTVLGGLTAALANSERRFGMTSALIMCFLRDRPPAEAMTMLDAAAAHRGAILGVGLDSAEVNFPPSLFREVYARARAEGYRLVAHAGEEGPPAYVWEALDLLHVERVDHGIRSMEDPRLVARLRDERVPLTVCPLSNVRLRTVGDMTAHPFKRMLQAGLRASINSDDPAYFGGYVGENYVAVATALGLDRDELTVAARNGFASAFIDESSRARYLAEVDAVAARS